MLLQQATRKAAFIRMALMGLSGTGKTYSALLLAYGLCGDWSKIAVIDSETESASLYSYLGPFNTLALGVPYTPSKYEEAIHLCMDAGKEVIIIDSLSPEWAGEGGVEEALLREDYQEALRAHRIVLSLISSASCHVICTLRTKRALVCHSEKGKRHPRLIELPLQQDGIEYPFTTVLQLDSKHRAHVIKDRSEVLRDKAPFVIDEEVGVWFYKWCHQEPVVSSVLQKRIDSCQSIAELHRLLFDEGVEDVALISAFTKRRLELEGIITSGESGVSTQENNLHIV